MPVPHDQAFQRALFGSPIKTTNGAIKFVALMGFLLVLGGAGQLWLTAGALGANAAVYLMAFGLAAILSLPTFWLVTYIDRRERESLWILLAAVAWGAVISTGLATIFNPLVIGTADNLLFQTGLIESPSPATWAARWPVAIVAPIIEELIKGVGLIILFWLMRAEFDNWTDGIVYGLLIGVGFNITEFAVYAVESFVTTGSASYATLAAVRLPFFGLSHHALWTGLCGGFIGMARQWEHPHGMWILGLLGLSLAFVGHALNNSIGLALLGTLPSMITGESSTLHQLPRHLQWVTAALTNLFLQGILYGTLIYLLIRGAQWEIAVIREQLADEINDHIVTAIEFKAMQNESPFKTRLSGRSDQVAKRLVHAQNELALRKRQLHRSGEDPNHDALVQQWREDIVRLRQAQLAAGKLHPDEVNHKDRAL